MTDDEIKEVEDYFLRDDFSRMCPAVPVPIYTCTTVGKYY